MKRLKVREGCFVHPDTYEPLTAIQCVIADSGALSRNYYEDNRLTCWSFDCNFPDPGVPTDSRQANRCLDCTRSIKTGFGSAACKFFTKIKVALIDKESIYELRLNALSLFSKADNRMTLYRYIEHLASNNEHVNSVLTEMYLASHGDFHKIYFRPVRPLLEEEFADVNQLLEAANKQDKEPYMANEYFIKNVKAIYPHLDQTYKFSTAAQRSVPCPPTDGGAAYDLHFEMTGEQAKDLGQAIFKAYKAECKEGWANKPKNPFKSLGEDYPSEEGNKVAKAKLSGVLGGETMAPPILIDAKKNPLPPGFKLTTGSIVNLLFSLSPYGFHGGHGVTLRLRQVQVIKYIPYVPPAAQQFEEEEGFVYDGATATTAPAKAESKVVDIEEAMFEEVDDEEAEEIVEPVKRKKKQEAPVEDEDDIEDIIAEWGTES